jgi:hypothetical protein
MRKILRLVLLTAWLGCSVALVSSYRTRHLLIITYDRSVLTLDSSQGKFCFWWRQEQHAGPPNGVRHFRTLPVDLFVEYVKNRDFALRVRWKEMGWVLATEDSEHPLNGGKRDILLLIPWAHLLLITTLALLVRPFWMQLVLRRRPRVMQFDR